MNPHTEEEIWARLSAETARFRSALQPANWTCAFDLWLSMDVRTLVVPPHVWISIDMSQLTASVDSAAHLQTVFARPRDTDTDTKDTDTDTQTQTQTQTQTHNGSEVRRWTGCGQVVLFNAQQLSSTLKLELKRMRTIRLRHYFTNVL